MVDLEAKGGPERLEEPESRRPVRAVGLLLILQVAGLAGLGLYELTLINWRRLNPSDPDFRPSEQVMEVAAYALFVPPAVLMILSALGFLFMRRKGWLTAAIAQALCLGACIQLYSAYEPFYVYPIMVYCILMILYLNSQSVRAMFGRRHVVRKQRRAGQRNV